MNASQWFGALVLVSVADTPDSLVTEYGRDRVLRVEAQSSLKLETTDSVVEVDGEPMDRPGGSDSTSLEERKLVWLDKVLEHEDGAPTKLSRSFEEGELSTERSFGEESRSDAREGALVDRTFELSLEDGEVTVELAEGEAVENDEVLSTFGMRLDLDALLPEAGETITAESEWDLEHEQILKALGLLFEQQTFAAPVSSGEGGGRRGGGRGGARGGRGGGATRLKALDWEGSAEVADLEMEWEGQTCTSIAVTLSATGTLEDQQRQRGGGAFGLSLAVPLETMMEIELEGRLMFSHDLGLPVLLVVEGQFDIERESERERQGRSFYTKTSQSGEFAWQVSVSEE